MSRREDYRASAMSDARDMIREFADQITEQLVDDGKASDDMNNDYSGGDSYHHETHVDKSYDLMEAAEILDQLSHHEEDDSGLWEGLAPRDAISAQAAYTYGNAVASIWQKIIEDINDDGDVEEILEAIRQLDGIDEDESDEVDPKEAIREAMGHLFADQTDVASARAFLVASLLSVVTGYASND